MTCLKWLHCFFQGQAALFFFSFLAYKMSHGFIMKHQVMKRFSLWLDQVLFIHVNINITTLPHSESPPCYIRSTKVMDATQEGGRKQTSCKPCSERGGLVSRQQCWAAQFLRFSAETVSRYSFWGCVHVLTFLPTRSCLFICGSPILYILDNQYSCNISCSKNGL